MHDAVMKRINSSRNTEEGRKHGGRVMIEQRGFERCPVRRDVHAQHKTLLENDKIAQPVGEAQPARLVVEHEPSRRKRHDGDVEEEEEERQVSRVLEEG